MTTAPELSGAALRQYQADAGQCDHELYWCLLIGAIRCRKCGGWWKP